MKIEIKDIGDKVIIEGGYNSFIAAVEKNKNNLSYADLSSSNLSYADLSSSNLSYAKLRSANLSFANLSYAKLYSANLSYADLSSSNLYSADLSFAGLSSSNLSYAKLRSSNLSFADLSYADLYSANLSSADLSSAKLENIKGYINSHDIFAEIVKRQGYEFWTTEELKVINFIWLWRNCLHNIKKEFGKKALNLFKKLSKLGYNEWELKYKEIINN